MSVTIGDKAITAAFIALLIVGSLTAYLLVFDEVNGDPREDPHNYAFEGVLLNEPCTGTGQTVFVEHSGGLILHTLSFSVSSPTMSLDRSMDLIFHEDGRLDSSFEHTGDAVVDGNDVAIWESSRNGTECILYIGDNCRLLEIRMTSAEFDLTGCIQ